MGQKQHSKRQRKQKARASLKRKHGQRHEEHYQNRLDSPGRQGRSLTLLRALYRLHVRQLAAVKRLQGNARQQCIDFDPFMQRGRES